MEAARLLLHEPIVFDIYGPIQITDHALSQMPKNMQFFGSVSRLKVAELYQEYDVFVLPTLSDGFAITQLEAMAYGLPVIATPNCGRVVTDGCDGFVVPPRDAETLATRIFALSRDPALRTHMSDTARWTIRRFSLKSVASILSNALSGWECGP
jgi:glycosyltransferase involved in cell wall biosynthesis